MVALLHRNDKLLFLNLLCNVRFMSVYAYHATIQVLFSYILKLLQELLIYDNIFTFMMPSTRKHITSLCYIITRKLKRFLSKSKGCRVVKSTTVNKQGTSMEW